MKVITEKEFFSVPGTRGDRSKHPIVQKVSSIKSGEAIQIPLSEVDTMKMPNVLSYLKKHGINTRTRTDKMNGFYYILRLK